MEPILALLAGIAVMGILAAIVFRYLDWKETRQH